MELISSNWRDIQRYYQGTWVKFKEYGDRLFLIGEVGPNYLEGTDEDNEKFRLTLHDEVPYHLDYVLPHKAMFQWNDQAVMLQRIPARQYHRGVCSANTKFICVHNNANMEFDLKLLKAFVNKQKHRTLRQCMQSGYNKDAPKTWVMSPRSAYCAMGEEHYIFFDTKIVAKAYPSRNIIKANPVVGEDVFQLVRQDPFDVEMIYG